MTHELYKMWRLARREFGMTPAEALAWALWNPFEQGFRKINKKSS